MSIEEAREIVAAKMVRAKNWLAKCDNEVTEFSAMAPELAPLREKWELDRDKAKERVRESEALDALLRDRDEWRNQHENLLSVRQSDLAALASRDARVAELEAANANLTATIERVRAALEWMPPSLKEATLRAIASDLKNGMSLRNTAKKHAVGVGVCRGVARKALAL